MSRIRVGAAVLNQTPLDWNGNRDNILTALQIAREEGVRILCLPELCISGYGCEDAFLSPGVWRMSLEVLGELVPQMKDMVVSVGLPLFFRHALFNCAAIVVDGRIAGFVAKRFLAGDGLHYEPRWFKPWQIGHVDSVTLDGTRYPIGDLIFSCGGVVVGLEICEDAWVADRPGTQMAKRGVDVILNPSASHFAFGKSEIRKRFVIEGSRAFSATYVHANLLGNEAGRAIYPGGTLIATGGHLVAMGPRFSYRPAVVTHAVVDVEATRMNQARTQSFSPSFEADEEGAVSCAFEWPDVDPEPRGPQPEEWELGKHVKEEEFLRAVALALFDYMRKSRSHGFVVSLSGGADSSACACLVALMTELACAELGEAEFKRRLGYIPSLREAEGRQAIVGDLLHCIYQSTRNSSARTANAANSLADALGAQMSNLSVDAMVDEYVAGAEQMLGRKLSWETDDIALQNIQARVRSPSAWMLANIKRSLLLATSNRSEAAVGYATMDGDTSGGLSPIAGIDKAFLREWLKWLETKGPHGLQPIPALSAVTSQTPTAELRPPEEEQTDEKDLMPYPVLDAIERSAIRDKQPPREVLRLMHARFPQHDIRRLCTWVERFFTLWCRNQWKRERYAPSFHVDDENLDPKTWCRFPILSGGYERELAELRTYARERWPEEFGE